ncbi:MAG: LacI family transcriptional regulator [Chloroflexota bacterium]|nr:LacI family transcriptional regulator [Chloroflexota bacterium]
MSKTSVSFAFNQPGNLKPATRERILAAAADLGYRPSPIARRLANRRTDQLGLVVPQSTHDVFANPFLAELLRGIGDECDREGIALVIVPPAGGSLARAVEAALVDGLILLGLAPDHPELELARRAGLPVVALDVEAWGDVDVIAVDDAAGAEAAAQHVYRLGHRDVAVVLIAEHPDAAVDEQAGISARRLAGIRAGFKAAVADADGDGSPISLRVLSAAVSEDGGRAAFAELAADGLPTAVIAITDMTAIGILQAAIDAGVRVPEDLSIVGYDDIPASAWTRPRMTTVHQPIREKGRLAARRLIDQVRSPERRQPATDVLPTRLVVRGSTAPPHRGGGASPS